MVSINPYRGMAEKAIEMDRVYSAVCKPRPEHVFFRWRDNIYKGSIQRIFSERPEIVLVSRSINPFEAELAETMRVLDSENDRPDLNIPDDIGLEGVYALLHIEGGDVRSPTDEEMEYFHKNKPAMIDFKLF